MGGEGSMIGANNSLKNNRSLLSKRKEKGVLGGNYSNVKLKEFPKATPRQLKELRENLRKEKKRDKIKLTAIFVAFLVFLFSVFWYLIQ